jgi:hypothetical protein
VHGLPNEKSLLAAADSGPRGTRAWPGHERPDHERVDLRYPEGGVLADVLDLALDDLRTSGNTTETGALRSGPRFECIDGTILIMEFTSSAGHSFFEAYFPDGTNIGYGRQQIDRRGSRFVLPIQAKTRIASPFRAAFDYHCRLDMPADPIQPATRADCVF